MMNEKKFNEYIVLAVEHAEVNGEFKHIIVTSCFRDGAPVKIWITDNWYRKNLFAPLMQVSLKWNKEYKRYDSIFPVAPPALVEESPAAGEELPF